MRKFSFIAILGVSIGMAIPYAWGSRWWLVVICLIAGVSWAFPSNKFSSQRSLISFFILLVAGSLGIFLEYTPLWLLTNIVLLIVAWDLDSYVRKFQDFEKDQLNRKTAFSLFLNHLQWLGLVAGISWFTVLVMLNLRTQISFSFALVLIVLVILSLYQIARRTLHE